MSSRSSAARLLVVDDDPGVLHAVKRVLGGRYDLVSASSPTEALAAADAVAPDLAIMDVRMPGMDGFELMQQLKSQQPDIDVIFMTGSVTEPDSHLIRAIQQGAFYFVQKPFDRQVLQTLVERCLELRRLRALADRELNKLRLAQARLLPQVAPKHPEYQLAIRYRPFYFATGDYHGFFPQPNGTLAAFVGDGSGHGPSACMLMATIRTLLYAHPEIHGDPGGALSSLSRMFHALVPLDLFMTAVYLVLGTDGGVRWAAAGQHPPLQVTAEGKIIPADLGPVGLPLGVEPDRDYKTVTWRIRPGERLVIFTDGIFEATNCEGRMFSLAGLKKSLTELSQAHANLEALVDALVDRVKAYMAGSDFGDDFTLLAIERR
jgi:sigma-B regulation protein RsbU (phosphoserine phosphatase)